MSKNNKDLLIESTDISYSVYKGSTLLKECTTKVGAFDYAKTHKGTRVVKKQFGFTKDGIKTTLNECLDSWKLKEGVYDEHSEYAGYLCDNIEFDFEDITSPSLYRELTEYFDQVKSGKVDDASKNSDSAYVYAILPDTIIEAFQNGLPFFAGECEPYTLKVLNYLLYGIFDCNPKFEPRITRGINSAEDTDIECYISAPTTIIQYIQEILEGEEVWNPLISEVEEVYVPQEDWADWQHQYLAWNEKGNWDTDGREFTDTIYKPGIDQIEESLSSSALKTKYYGKFLSDGPHTKHELYSDLYIKFLGDLANYIRAICKENGWKSSISTKQGYDYDLKASISSGDKTIRCDFNTYSAHTYDTSWYDRILLHYNGSFFRTNLPHFESSVQEIFETGKCREYRNYSYFAESLKKSKSLTEAPLGQRNNYNFASALENIITSNNALQVVSITPTEYFDGDLTKLDLYDAHGRISKPLTKLNIYSQNSYKVDLSFSPILTRNDFVKLKKEIVEKHYDLFSEYFKDPCYVGITFSPTINKIPLNQDFSYYLSVHYGYVSDDTIDDDDDIEYSEDMSSDVLYFPTLDEAIEYAKTHAEKIEEDVLAWCEENEIIDEETLKERGEDDGWVTDGFISIMTSLDNGSEGIPVYELNMDTKDGDFRDDFFNTGYINIVVLYIDDPDLINDPIHTYSSKSQETSTDESRGHSKDTHSKNINEEIVDDFTTRTKQGYEIKGFYSIGDSNEIYAVFEQNHDFGFVVADGYDMSDGTWNSGHYGFRTEKAAVDSLKKRAKEHNKTLKVVKVKSTPSRETTNESLSHKQDLTEGYTMVVKTTTTLSDKQPVINSFKIVKSEAIDSSFDNHFEIECDIDTTTSKIEWKDYDWGDYTTQEVPVKITKIEIDFAYSYYGKDELTEEGIKYTVCDFLHKLKFTSSKDYGYTDFDGFEGYLAWFDDNTDIENDDYIYNIECKITDQDVINDITASFETHNEQVEYAVLDKYQEEMIWCHTEEEAIAWAKRNDGFSVVKETSWWNFDQQDIYDLESETVWRRTRADDEQTPTEEYEESYSHNSDTKINELYSSLLDKEDYRESILHKELLSIRPLIENNQFDKLLFISRLTNLTENYIKTSESWKLSESYFKSAYKGVTKADIFKVSYRIATELVQYAS